MIPKKIHYCWFGRGEKPELAKKCIASWKKFCPDYQIIEWNEDNFDLNCNEYVRYCYANKKWAFLSDFVRLVVVNEHGGLYFDTDVEMVASPDGLLGYEAFYGFENNTAVNTGQGFGAVAHHPTVEAMIRQYLALSPDAQGLFPVVACPELNTNALLSLGLVLDGRRQNVAGAEILPSDFTNPYDDATGRLNKTANTVSIHWYCKSWLSPWMRLRSNLTRPFHRIFGVDCFGWLKKK
jgi:hypothetical protein